ncbi:N6-adenosine-methyltransferase subunit METTL3, partial [Geodia barretti]
MGTEIYELLNTKSVMEQRQLEKFQSAGGSQLQEFCSHKTRDSCRRARGTHRACGKLHFRKIIQQHTDENLGDCSFLNTCFHTDTCKFVHYEIDTQREVDTSSQRQSNKNKPSSGVVSSHKLIPAQWVNCDIRILDMSCLGKFSVIMADPPWDIHMELPYGTMGDDEMRQLNVPALQDDGYIFLWVTGIYISHTCTHTPFIVSLMLKKKL